MTTLDRQVGISVDLLSSNFASFVFNSCQQLAKMYELFPSVYSKVISDTCLQPIDAEEMERNRGYLEVIEKTKAAFKEEKTRLREQNREAYRSQKARAIYNAVKRLWCDEERTRFGSKYCGFVKLMQGKYDLAPNRFLQVFVNRLHVDDEEFGDYADEIAAIREVSDYSILLEAAKKKGSPSTSSFALYAIEQLKKRCEQIIPATDSYHQQVGIIRERPQDTQRLLLIHAFVKSFFSLNALRDGALKDFISTLRSRSHGRVKSGEVAADLATKLDEQEKDFTSLLQAHASLMQIETRERPIVVASSLVSGSSSIQSVDELRQVATSFFTGAKEVYHNLRDFVALLKLSRVGVVQPVAPSQGDARPPTLIHVRKISRSELTAPSFPQVLDTYTGNIEKVLSVFKQLRSFKFHKKGIAVFGEKPRLRTSRLQGTTASTPNITPLLALLNTKDDFFKFIELSIDLLFGYLSERPQEEQNIMKSAYLAFYDEEGWTQKHKVTLRDAQELLHASPESEELQAENPEEFRIFKLRTMLETEDKCLHRELRALLNPKDSWGFVTLKIDDDTFFTGRMLEALFNTFNTPQAKREGHKRAIMSADDAVLLKEHYSYEGTGNHTELGTFAGKTIDYTAKRAKMILQESTPLAKKAPSERHLLFMHSFTELLAYLAYTRLNGLLRFQKVLYRTQPRPVQQIGCKTASDITQDDFLKKLKDQYLQVLDAPVETKLPPLQEEQMTLLNDHAHTFYEELVPICKSLQELISLLEIRLQEEKGEVEFKKSKSKSTPPRQDSSRPRALSSSSPDPAVEGIITGLSKLSLDLKGSQKGSQSPRTPRQTPRTPRTPHSPKESLLILTQYTTALKMLQEVFSKILEKGRE